MAKPNRIFLIGPMGAGKTTIGKQLAQSLGMTFSDSDQEIQRRTGGVRDLGDVIRWAYQRYSGARGFTAEEFREAVSRVSGHDLEAWLDRALAGTEELDYGPALHWYGLRFADQGDPWTLEIAPDRTRPQRLHLESWLGRDESPADGG